MQEQSEQENKAEQKTKDILESVKKVCKKHMFRAGVCCAFFLAAIITGLCLYSDLPTSHWRESKTPIPWKGQGITVKELTARWQNSKGDARMELRAAYFPSATLTLDKTITGKGFLLVRFMDDSGTQNGETVYLPYNEKGFEYKEDPNLLAMDDKASIRSEAGFRFAEDFRYHALMEERPLWRVTVWNRAEGADEDEFLGYISIPATDKEP